MPPAVRLGLDREDFDALYELWFPRAIGWLCRRGCTGEAAEAVVAVALEVLFRELECSGSRGEHWLAQRLLTHLSRAHGVFADESTTKRDGARVSSRRLPGAVHSSP